jgi:anti-sigma regulatory factor (Ser/Thr protein kinase)
VVSTPIEASIILPSHPAVAGTARRLARELASPATVDTVELLVSELVTNAVLHAPGGDALELRISVWGECVRVEVRDSSSQVPQMLAPADWGLHGRGLFLVDALADRWGSEQTPTGKTVWCEVTAPKDEPVPPAACYLVP